MDQGAGHVQLPKRQLEVVSVIQNVEQVCIEGVDVVHLGEVLQDSSQLLMPILLCVLDLQAEQVSCPSAAGVTQPEKGQLLCHTLRM